MNEYTIEQMYQGVSNGTITIYQFEEWVSNQRDEAVNKREYLNSVFG
jgi:hypothetical protein